MARKHHKPEEIVGKLRQIEVVVGQGKPVADLVVQFVSLIDDQHHGMFVLAHEVAEINPL